MKAIIQFIMILIISSALCVLANTSFSQKSSRIHLVEEKCPDLHVGTRSIIILYFSDIGECQKCSLSVGNTINCLRSSDRKRHDFIGLALVHCLRRRELIVAERSLPWANFVGQDTGNSRAELGLREGTRLAVLNGATGEICLEFTDETFTQNACKVIMDKLAGLP